MSRREARAQAYKQSSSMSGVVQAAENLHRTNTLDTKQSRRHKRHPKVEEDAQEHSVIEDQMTEQRIQDEILKRMMNKINGVEENSEDEEAIAIKQSEQQKLIE